jgi:hypothetical protein
LHQRCVSFVRSYEDCLYLSLSSLNPSLTAGKLILNKISTGVISSNSYQIACFIIFYPTNSKRKCNYTVVTDYRIVTVDSYTYVILTSNSSLSIRILFKLSLWKLRPLDRHHAGSSRPFYKVTAVNSINSCKELVPVKIVNSQHQLRQQIVLPVVPIEHVRTLSADIQRRHTSTKLIYLCMVAHVSAFNSSTVKEL